MVSVIAVVMVARGAAMNVLKTVMLDVAGWMNNRKSHRRVFQKVWNMIAAL